MRQKDDMPPAPRAAPPRPALRVGFVLADRFTLGAFANFVDVLRLAADEADRSRPIRCAWSVLSDEIRPIRSSAGVAVHPDARFGDPARFDYVVVVGGLIDVFDLGAPAHLRFLRAAAAAGVPLVGLCTGALILQRAGLMEGRRCCVSWFHHRDFLESAPEVAPVADRLFVVDGDRLTCSGGVGAAHLAAHIVDRRLGRDAARKALHIMMLDDRGLEPARGAPGDAPQPGPVGALDSADPLVRRALTVMSQSLDADLDCAALAARLAVGRRTLERRFRSGLGLSPAAALVRLRLAHAERLLAETADPLARVAAEAGFSDAAHLSRAFLAAHGLRPGAWRAARRPAASDLAGA
ncbi:GlxA family transcriptional regulator [Rubrimonas cliftonensis]|uniref:Transcriptional regulator, AraC family with amidase-like domain n=1 Tax=Rubrimonas cliftonensis TaxID=89524 RepID=A0A1H4A1T9_9RHOB|nr:helix-turn-helix domain-containing protein [Rubrimonas cliftonensis]SEA29850.1 transcriptional regulator, AraC family with amidase-like domain [Rubrimonas cliftonensis]